MTARILLPVLALVFLLLFGFPSRVTPSLARQDKPDYLDQVLPLINFLEEAASSRLATGRFQGRVAEFSETQVSAFFQYLIQEQTSSLKSLTLKIFPGSRVEGWIVLELGQQPGASSQNLYFTARMEQEGRKVRLNFSSLYLETQRIQPAVINALIDLIARVQGLEARHLDDWYDLPEGIAGLETAAGKLLVHY
ncbi:MAG: hypothetical protein NUW07_02930 [Candidatus Saccharicenans sp.]|jgi:hypothetical protein|nr:hypothetical protein [Candidatus Saccharicenans sp.]MDH7493003.1 hypothetical protein [Candidatus Saccharicenans sp.]